MTELEALNMLLRLIGATPVNDVNTTYPEAANARVTLTRIRRKAQKRGWWFNIDYNLCYLPNEDGEIVVSDDITSLVAEDKIHVLRGRKMYDKLNQTYIFACPITAIKTIRTLEWDDMPESMREYCAYVAGAEFVRDEVEDSDKIKLLHQDAGMSLIDVKKEDLEAGQYNMFDAQRTLQARKGVQPYHRSNKRFHGDPDV
jgi:hypothetical protein